MSSHLIRRSTVLFTITRLGVPLPPDLHLVQAQELLLWALRRCGKVCTLSSTRRCLAPRPRRLEVSIFGSSTHMLVLMHLTIGRVEVVSTSESALSADSPHIQILRLLRVLHKMNLMAKDRMTIDAPGIVLPESAFINNKLTAKLTRQLEEPMIVARWVDRLASRIIF
jgi:hypothetical protein